MAVMLISCCHNIFFDADSACFFFPEAVTGNLESPAEAKDASDLSLDVISKVIVISSYSHMQGFR